MHSWISGKSWVWVFTRSSATRVGLGSEVHADTPSTATAATARVRVIERDDVTAVRGYRSASATARVNTASSIGSVRRLVNVFCWLGWNEQIRVGPPSIGTSTP